MSPSDVVFNCASAAAAARRRSARSSAATSIPRTCSGRGSTRSRRSTLLGEAIYHVHAKDTRLVGARGPRQRRARPEAPQRAGDPLVALPHRRLRPRRGVLAGLRVRAADGRVRRRRVDRARGRPDRSRRGPREGRGAAARGARASARSAAAGGRSSGRNERRAPPRRLAPPALAPAPTGLLAEEVVDRLREPIFRGAPGAGRPAARGAARRDARGEPRADPRRPHPARARGARGAAAEPRRGRRPPAQARIWTRSTACARRSSRWPAAGRRATPTTADHAELQAIIDGYAAALAGAHPAGGRRRRPALPRRRLPGRPPPPAAAHLARAAAPGVPVPAGPPVRERPRLSRVHGQAARADPGRDPGAGRGPARRRRRRSHVETSYQRVIAAYDEGASEDE